MVISSLLVDMGWIFYFFHPWTSKFEINQPSKDNEFTMIEENYMEIWNSMYVVHYISVIISSFIVLLKVSNSQ